MVRSRSGPTAPTVLAVLMLAGCGGGGSAVSSAPAGGTGTLARGTLISAEQTASIAKADSDRYLAAHPEEQPLVGEPASCDVGLYRLIYATRGPAGEYVQDSMGLQVPVNCAGPHPLLLMNHGTVIIRSSTASDLDGAIEKVPYFSGRGYVVVAPDYSGYSGSTLDYHPYQVAENGAVVTIDAVRAARQWLQAAQITTNDKFFILGSSQGGGVTMATQRAMERDYGSEFVITASVPTSGSYDLETSMVDNLTAPVEDDPGAVTKAAMLMTAYERAYGDMYTETSEVFQSPWSGTVTGLLPGTMGPFELVDAGLLPPRLKEPGGLFTDAWVADFLINPSNTTRIRLRENSLIDWTPVAPMFLCGSSLDPAVSFQNTLTAAASFAGRGVVTPVEDVQTDPEFAAFINVRTDGQAADAPNYHGDVVQPACMSYAKNHVFDPMR